MPTLRIFDPPVTGPSPGPIRANPGMFAAEGEASARLGNTVSRAAFNGIDQIQDNRRRQAQLDAQIKNATDTGYVMSAHGTLEATNTLFNDWTQQPQNSDTSTWKEEYDARVSAAKDQVLSGAKNLSDVHRVELEGTVNAWSQRSEAAFVHATNTQNIKNATEQGKTALELAKSNNDVLGADAAISLMQKTGLINDNVAETERRKATATIIGNIVNGELEADPFTTGEKLQEKDESGNYVNYPGMTEPNRVSLQFRAAKHANEVRAKTKRDWAALAQDAYDNGDPMPDKAGVLAEARHQGIPAKWVDNLYRPPGALNPGEYADAATRIRQLDLVNDPASENMDTALQIQTRFKGPAAERLKRLIDDGSNPDSLNNTPSYKFGSESIKSAFSLGVYGKFKTEGYDPSTGQPLDKIDAGKEQAARLVMAQNYTLLEDFLKQNPKARPDEVQRFVNGLANDHVANSVKSLFAPQPFGLPKR
jgi:hypothetical protein